MCLVTCKQQWYTMMLRSEDHTVHTCGEGMIPDMQNQDKAG